MPTEALVALALLLVVPLGARLAAGDGATARALARAAPFVGLVGAASFLLEPSALAALLAGAWLATTLALAGVALGRIARRGLGPIEEAAVDLGHLYLPVGAIWLVASRGSLSPLGFHEPIVLFTAAHFHFAGFAAPVVMGLAGRELALRRAPSAPGPVASRGWAGLYAASTGITLFGVPLVAAGITVGPALERPAAALLALAMLGNMVTLVRLGGGRLRRGQGEGALLVVGGLALLFSMGLVFVFTASGSAARGAAAPALTYSTMAQLHGAANALLFASLSMLALARRPPPRRHDRLGGTWPRWRARGPVGVDFFAREGAERPGPAPLGQLDALADFAHAGFRPERVHPDVRAFYERTSEWSLRVSPTWHWPFRTGGRLFVAFARRVLGNLVLPIHDEDDATVSTRVVSLDAARDGREAARGYVRAWRRGPDAPDRRSDAVNFVAAYATHRSASPAGLRYLSAAFPLPRACLVAVLRFEDGGVPGGLSLSSAPARGEGPGDEGMFVVLPRRRGGALALRLPLDEHIAVEPAREGALTALHETRVLGLRCFTLRYTIVPARAAGGHSEHESS